MRSPRMPLDPTAEAKPGIEENVAPMGGEPATAKGGVSPGAGAPTATKAKGHGRVPVSDYPDACQMAILHESLRPGDKCPACGRGALFELKEPARFLRIVGQPPLAAYCWNCQRLPRPSASAPPAPSPLQPRP